MICENTESIYVTLQYWYILSVSNYKEVKVSTPSSKIDFRWIRPLLKYVLVIKLSNCFDSYTALAFKNLTLSVPCKHLKKCVGHRKLTSLRKFEYEPTPYEIFFFNLTSLYDISFEVRLYLNIHSKFEILVD